MKCIGIEIAKEEFKACMNDKVIDFSNDTPGFKVFMKDFFSEKEEVHCIMEASGPYYLGLATFLYNQGVKVSVVNPLVIRRFCQMNLKRAKTDKVDVKQITEFGRKMEPELWKPAPKAIIHLQQLQSAEDHLRRQLTQTNNHLGSLEVRPEINSVLIAVLKKQMQETTKSLKNIQKEMQGIIAENYATESKLLQTIPGIGTKTAAMLIIITHGFTRFETAEQLLSYTGLSPRIFESGKSINRKVHITKMGTARMRQLLYMAAQTARKRNQGCIDLYDRLRAKGKPYKVACVAVAAKLLRQSFAVATSGKPFTPELSFGKKMTAA
jgi:transposase